MSPYSSDKTAFDYYYLQQDGTKTLEYVDPKCFHECVPKRDEGYESDESDREYSVYDVWMEKVSPETTYEHLRVTTVSSEQVESLPKCPMRDWLVSQDSGLNFSFIFNEYPHGEENKWVSDNWETINDGRKANPVLRRIRGNIVLAVLTDSYNIDGNFYLPITEVMYMIRDHFELPGVLTEACLGEDIVTVATAIAREKEVRRINREKKERKRMVDAKKKEEECIRFEQAKNVTYTDSKLKPASLPDNYTSSDSGDSGEETKPRKIKRRDAKVETEPVVKESKNSAKKALKKAVKASRKK